MNVTDIAPLVLILIDCKGLMILKDGEGREGRGEEARGDKRG